MIVRALVAAFLSSTKGANNSKNVFVEVVETNQVVTLAVKPLLSRFYRSPLPLSHPPAFARSLQRIQFGYNSLAANP